MLEAESEPAFEPDTIVDSPKSLSKRGRIVSKTDLTKSIDPNENIAIDDEKTYVIDGLNVLLMEKSAIISEQNSKIEELKKLILEATARLETTNYTYNQELERQKSVKAEQERLTKRLLELQQIHAKKQGEILKIDSDTAKLSRLAEDIKKQVIESKNTVKRESKMQLNNMKSEQLFKQNIKSLQEQVQKLKNTKFDLESKIESISSVPININECKSNLENHVSLEKYNKDTILLLTQKISNLDQDCMMLQGEISRQEEINQTIHQFIKR